MKKKFALLLGAFGFVILMPLFTTTEAKAIQTDSTLSEKDQLFSQGQFYIPAVNRLEHDDKELHKKKTKKHHKKKWHKHKKMSEKMRHIKAMKHHKKKKHHHRMMRQHHRHHHINT